MNKNIKRGIQAVLFVLIIVAFIYIGSKDFKSNTVIDNERFDQEYTNVSKDNVFVYASATDIYTKLKTSSAVIFMGYPANQWSGYYANIVNEAAKQSGLKEILYYDFYEDRKMKSATYQRIVWKLSDYITTMDDNSQNIFAPTLVIVKNGEIILYDNDTAMNIGNITPEEYWNDYKMNMKINYFQTMFLQYLKED